jgi:hypothetical protein
VRLDDTFAIPPTSIKIRRSQPGPAAHRHQAPTLIGCEFLKNFRLPATRFASLRLQQRSEIMYTALHVVNKFLSKLFNDPELKVFENKLETPSRFGTSFEAGKRGF